MTAEQAPGGEPEAVPDPVPLNSFPGVDRATRVEPTAPIQKKYTPEYTMVGGKKLLVEADTSSHERPSHNHVVSRER